MLRRATPIVALLVTTLTATAAVLATPTQSPDVVVHEWGTFTTVAGEDGQAINWLPLGGPTDLPCFVNRFKNRLFKVLPGGEQEGPIEYEAARTALVGKVRMETPVVYFYAPSPANVSVSIRFPQGLMTEWYPSATVNQPNVVPSLLSNPGTVGAIDWPSVQISPTRSAAFPTGAGKSHYYAARQTDAAPLWVNGQDEKFLFYRGVASFPAPISTALGSDGTIRLTNLGTSPIPSVMLFENRAGKLSFSHIGALKTSATVARPTAPADYASFRAELVRILMNTGLYAKEADAMVETWRDSWFEEGTRLFYIAPKTAIDHTLPLTIDPAPTEVVRVFVGRLELATATTEQEIGAAIASRDMKALAKYGRFVRPIAEQLLWRDPTMDNRRFQTLMQPVYQASLVPAATRCQ